MMRAVSLAAMVATLAGRAYGQTSNCVIESDGLHPTVDLNSLHSVDGDYEVVSTSNDEYVYHVNLCGQTTFQDNTCNEGASVCEVKDGEALDVYAYVDTVSLEWVNSALVMTMEGYPQCPFNNAQPYTTKVHFICEHEDTSIVVKTENYYQCLLEFEFHTPLACGTADVRYHCDNSTQQCVQDSHGEYSGIADCEVDCKVPSNGRYSCGGADSDYNCVQDNRGAFESKEDCTKLCVPMTRRYSCYNNRCVRDSKGAFTSETECAEQCASYSSNDAVVSISSQRYSCYQNTCTEDSKGMFASESACAAECRSSSDELEFLSEI